MNRRALLRAVGTASTGVAGGLAGCTSGSPTSASGTTTSGGGAAGPTVSVASNGEYGDVLVGPDGMSLYLFEKDTRGSMESACHGDCAGAWPPLTVSGEPTSGDGVTASLATFEREDGEAQVTAGGWPLYYYAADEQPGDAKGQEVEGFGGEWYLVAPDGSKKEAEDSEGDEGDGGGGY